jgi:hypothetical protein
MAFWPIRGILSKVGITYARGDEGMEIGVWLEGINVGVSFWVERVIATKSSKVEGEKNGDWAWHGIFA